MEKEYSICFYTPPFNEEAFENTFGCASLGLVSEDEWIPPSDGSVKMFCKKIKGIILNGSLENVTGELNVIDVQERVKAGIVLFGNCGQENEFMCLLRDKYNGVPFVGGSAAIGDDSRIGRLLPSNGQVSVFLITDDRYDFQADYLNTHKNIIKSFEAEGSEPRVLDHIICDGIREEFATFYKKTAEELGISEGITEHIALCDMGERNIHLIHRDGGYMCGTDLPIDRKLTLRFVSTEDVISAMKEFYAVDDSLIFGCAGVKSMIGESVFKTGRNSLGMFMFGEVIPFSNGCDFANLMLTRLKVTCK